MEEFLNREKIIKIIREFFYSRDFHEVIVPILNTALPLEPNLIPFSTTHRYQDTEETFYLPMSPERGIKKMLSQGIGNCFAIGHSFRNYERVGPLHSHEFLMLEWYRKQAVYTDIMDDIEELLKTINAQMESSLEIGPTPFPRYSLETLFEKNCGEKLSVLAADDSLMKRLAQDNGFVIEENTTWHELYDQLFVNEIEPHFSHEALFLTDFPARISPLCKVQKKNPLLADRFELYINGIEIANGNTENTDVASIRAGFEAQHKATGMPIDEEFLASLEKMKDSTYAGVGLGIDRLLGLYS